MIKKENENKGRELCTTVCVCVFDVDAAGNEAKKIMMTTTTRRKKKTHEEKVHTHTHTHIIRHQ